MKIQLTLNGEKLTADAAPDQPLLEFLRQQGCYSVKRGCETSNCGLCTVWLEDKPVLSCNVLAVRANGRKVTTLEGLQAEAAAFAGFMADQGADQCGFCNPGFVMNVLAMERELENPSEQEIRAYLVGNLCRCTGYASQLRAVQSYLNWKREGAK